MFSQTCVKNSVQGGEHGSGGVHGRGACVVRGGHVWQGVCVAGEACMAGGHMWQGVCVVGSCMAGRHAWQWGHAWRGGGEACMAVETTTAADGTHPTGMHSRFFFNFSIHTSIFGATDNPVLDFW